MKRASIEHEHSSDGSLTYLRVTGVVDESFEGEGIAASVKSKNIIINCAGITLITSYGLRSWSNFLKVFEQGRGQITFVECSPVFVGEMNQVVDFTSSGHVLSCYGQYACGACGVNRSILLRTDLDADSIRNHRAPDLSCLACGGTLEFDEDPATYYPALIGHTKRSVDRDVLGFLEARLGYETDSARHLRIQKDVVGDTTVLFLSGNLDESLNPQKLAQGLQGDVVVDLTQIIHVHQQGIQVWREFLNEAIQRTLNLWLLGSPALVIERAFEGLGQQKGLHVVSARIPYHCRSCDGTEFVLLDLAGKDGHLVRGGTLPSRPCSNCKKQLDAMIGAKVVEQLSELPEPTLPRSVTRAVQTLKKKLEKAKQKDDKLAAPSTGVVPGKKTFAAIGLAVAGVMVAAGLTTYYAVKQGDRAPAPVVKEVKRPAPVWVTSDTPFSGYCVNRVEAMTCVGVSSYRATKEEATAEARDVALEEIANALAITFDSDAFDAKVRPIYSDVRHDLLRAFDDARAESETSEEYTQAHTRVSDARRYAGEALMTSSKGSMPAQHSDLYWEKYEDRGKTEFIVYIRFDINADAIRTMGRVYTSEQEVGGGKAMTAFPLLAWTHADFTGGVLVTEAGGQLQTVSPGALVTSVDEQPVKSVADLAKALADDSEEPKFAVAKQL